MKPKVSRETRGGVLNSRLTLFKRYSKLPPERFLFVLTGVYILKNIIMSMMAIHSEIK
jgi:hypothetical protein